MNKIIIPVIVGILVFSIGLSQQVYAPDDQPENLSLGGNAKAIPDWVNNNFKWYGEGKIGQADLLNSLKFMLDNNLMHLSDEAAQEMKALRDENAAYKKKLDTDGIIGPNAATLKKDSTLAPRMSSLQVPNEDGELVDVLVVTDESTDVNALVQMVLKESYLETNKDLQFYADKVRHYNDMKEALRDHVSDMRNMQHMAIAEASKTTQTPKTDFGSAVKSGVSKGGGSLEERIFALQMKLTEKKEGEVDRLKDTGNDTPNLSVSKLPSLAIKPDVARLVQQNDCAMIVVLFNEMSILGEEIEFVYEHLEYLEAQIASSSDKTKEVLHNQMASLQAKLEILLEKLEKTKEKVDELSERIDQNPKANCSGYSDLATLNLQSQMQKMSQTLQTMSNVSKMMHDTAKAIINNMRA